MKEPPAAFVGPKDEVQDRGPYEYEDEPAEVVEVVTLGISPKVFLPMVIGAIVGTALVIAGAWSDHDTIWAVGLTVIGSALGHGAVGYAASPGEVVAKEPA